MTGWFVAAAILVGALIPCGWVCLRHGFAEGVVAVELGGTVAGLALLVLAHAERREPFGVLAVVLVALSFAGALIFLRFLERMR